MSILIKGLDAPKHGGYIEIRLYDDRAECEFQEHEYTDLEIEEVPELHGRLIDADKLEIERNNYETYNDYSEAFDMIDNAPTVIEAEEQERE